MKAVLVTSFLSHAGGGVAAAVEALSQSLIGLRADVNVLGLLDRRWEVDRASWCGAPVAALHVRGPASFGYAPKALRRLRDIDPTVAHAHGIWMYPSRAVAKWSALSRKPYLVSPHGMLDAWAMRHSSGKKKLAAWLYENAHLRGAQCLHALCEAEEAQMRDIGLRNPICVIPNGVALPERDDGGHNDGRPAPWAGVIPPDADVMLFLGRLHPKKNLPALIEAWSRVSRSGNWHLAIAGWDQLGHQAVLTALAERLGVAQCVHFLGPLFGAEKTRALRQARAFVLPTLSEGLPMSVLEAWSHGLPVLKTEACNLPEGFRAGAAACLSLDREGMAHDLEQFLHKDRSELRLMGCNGRDLAAQHFSWSGVAQQILDVYGWLAGDRDRPATVRLR